MEQTESEWALSTYMSETWCTLHHKCVCRLPLKYFLPCNFRQLIVGPYMIVNLYDVCIGLHFPVVSMLRKVKDFFVSAAKIKDNDAISIVRNKIYKAQLIVLTRAELGQMYRNLQYFLSFKFWYHWCRPTCKYLYKPPQTAWMLKGIVKAWVGRHRNAKSASGVLRRGRLGGGVVHGV